MKDFIKRISDHEISLMKMMIFKENSNPDIDSSALQEENISIKKYSKK
jgi:hypothetical protein